MKHNMPQYDWMAAVSYKVNQTNFLTHQTVGQPTLVGTYDTHTHTSIAFNIYSIYIDILDKAVTEGIQQNICK
jgi:hypothetical protein